MKTQIIFLLISTSIFIHHDAFGLSDIDRAELLPDQQLLNSLYELENLVIRHLDITKDSEDSMITRSKASALLPKLSIFGDVGRNYGVMNRRGQNSTESILHKDGTDYGA